MRPQEPSTSGEARRARTERAPAGLDPGGFPPPVEVDSNPGDASVGSGTGLDLTTGDDGYGVPLRSDRPRRSDRHRGRSTSLLRELPLLILVAFVLAFVLRTFVVQVFHIPSSSMEPTLQVDDRIVVDKVSYRFRDLERGEIVVFEVDQVGAPESDGAFESVVRGFGQMIGVTPGNARDFVKRVVGLPGDEIYIDEHGTVHVNGTALEEGYLGQQDPRSCGPLVVPDEKLFFLGDNRGNSSDSRASLGYVSTDHVVGRAFVTIWPMDRVHLLGRPDYGTIDDPESPPPHPDSVPAHDICNPR